MIFEILKGIWFGIFADLYSDGMFNWIVRRCPKRVIKELSDLSGKEEYRPQWKFFGWHYDWREDGYQHLSPNSFKDQENAVERAKELGQKIKKSRQFKTIWTDAESRR